jgi:hypothetical protein
MNYNIIIALVGALINILLSVTIPCVFKKTNEPLMNDIKQLYKAKRELILSSSVIIGITIYLALEIAPELHNIYLNMNDNRNMDVNNIRNMDVNNIRLTELMNRENVPQLRNLIRLM